MNARTVVVRVELTKRLKQVVHCPLLLLLLLSRPTEWRNERLTRRPRARLGTTLARCLVALLLCSCCCCCATFAVWEPARDERRTSRAQLCWPAFVSCDTFLTRALAGGRRCRATCCIVAKNARHSLTRARLISSTSGVCVCVCVGHVCEKATDDSVARTLSARIIIVLCVEHSS